LGTGSELKIVFFVLLLALLALRAFFGWRARRSGHSFSFSDDEETQQADGKSAVIVVIILLFMACLLGLYGINPAGIGWLNASLPGWLEWFGVALGVIALGIQAWTHETLQEHWSRHTPSTTKYILVTDGPYQWVRHPMYLGLMFFFIGLALVSAFWPILVLALALILMFRRTASQEEAQMVDRFGDKYHEYMKRTASFLPRVFPKAR
jgi:protein-S-isoprenylcysteine O-methyltransferase Ste14